MKIIISLEQIHISWNALDFDDFLSIVCRTITFTSPFQNIRVWKTKKQHLYSQRFDMFMTKLSSQYRIIILSDNSKYLSCFFALDILAVVFDYHIFQKDIIKTSILSTYES